MSATNSEVSKKKPTGKPKTYEEIIAGFQKLRSEQRVLTQKITEMEAEQSEHKLVIATLEKMDGTRKCFRLIGGVLCERTVSEVLPILVSHEKRLGQVLESLNRQLVTKGTEINAYKEQHNLKVKGVDDMSEMTKKESQPAAGGVLVS